MPGMPSDSSSRKFVGLTRLFDPREELSLAYSFCDISIIFPLCLLGGELYSGTVSDFSGTDALIYRNPLRTEQYAPQHLNGKHFFQEFQTLYLCNLDAHLRLHCDTVYIFIDYGWKRKGCNLCFPKVVQSKYLACVSLSRTAICSKQ